MMIAVSSSIVVQMIEVGFIGQLGTDQLAAVTFTFPVTMMLNSVALGISIGTSSVIARRVGGGDWEAVKRLTTHGILLVFVVLSALALIGMATIEPTFRAIGATPTVIEHIEGYLLIYYPGTVLFTLTMVAGSVMRATGDARLPGLVMTLGAVFNLMLDPLLIFGWLGAPRLELAGAAAAMVISRLAMSGVLMYFVIARMDLLLGAVAWRRGVVASAREIFHVGLPAMATQLIGPISGAIITRLLAHHGHEVVAGFGVAGRIEAVAVMLLFALSGSIGPFVGQNFGAGASDRVRQGMAVAYRFCLGWGGFACIVLWLGAGELVVLVDDNPTVIEVASRYLVVVPVSYGLWGVLMMSSAAFNSLGKPLPSTIMAATRMFGIYVPLAWLGDTMFGYTGIFLATAVANMIMGLWSWQWLARTYFRA